MSKHPYSSLLFARPSFFEGMARIVDVRGNLNQYNCSETPEEADCRAIYSDWAAVGQDIRQTVAEYRRDARRRG